MNRVPQRQCWTEVISSCEFQHTTSGICMTAFSPGSFPCESQSSALSVVSCGGGFQSRARFGREEALKEMMLRRCIEPFEEDEAGEEADEAAPPAAGRAGEEADRGRAAVAAAAGVPTYSGACSFRSTLWAMLRARSLSTTISSASSLGLAAMMGSGRGASAGGATAEAAAAGPPPSSESGSSPDAATSEVRFTDILERGDARWVAVPGAAVNDSRLGVLADECSEASNDSVRTAREARRWRGQRQQLCGQSSALLSVPSTRSLTWLRCAGAEGADLTHDRARSPIAGSDPAFLLRSSAPHTVSSRPATGRSAGQPQRCATRMEQTQRGGPVTALRLRCAWPPAAEEIRQPVFIADGAQ